MIDSDMEMKELGRSPCNTHNKRSWIHTSQVYYRRLAVEKSQQVKEYKHKHTQDHLVPTAKISEGSSITHLPKFSVKSNPTSSSPQSKSCIPVGFISKGNTCHIIQFYRH